MGLTRAEVVHVARLARLGLTEEEIEQYQAQLSDILDHFKALQQLDTTDVPPTAQVIALANVMRGDESRPSFPQEVMLANAPAQEDGYFRVLPVLEE